MREAGFIRLRCPDGHVERALAFSYKHRGLCPSCGARRMLDVSAHLTERVFPEVPIRQYVLSPPSELVGLLAAREDVLAAMTTGGGCRGRRIPRASLAAARGGCGVGSR